MTASSTSTTHATLQAWTKSASGAWVKHGYSIGAHIGSGGMTNSMSEFVADTPMGSFGLTQAFGRDGNPGTALPYFRTTPADWWISQRLPTYNTHQVCRTDNGNGCGYKAPSEHLYDEVPYYNYAVVIDYNTASRVYPRGSAVFLHVTDGQPTAGCVAIPQGDLVSIMRWLNPADHPRILIGVT
ncbi:MAG: L,D-transpeptidase family protein [Jatrophihabitantaceae bacterium]